ncbi:MAG: FHA domain-containing protein [Actinomycetota bacterium]|nr:FHA domain-containing protein [Actinomycetota bacterium]
MLDLQVPLLAAKALLLLLLFAFIYAVVRRGVGDLRAVPDDEVFIPGVENKTPRRRAQERPASYGSNGRERSSTLVVEDSEVLAPETKFPVAGGVMVIGRSSGSDIVLKNDDYASGEHARLTRHGGLMYVEDAGSTNGTYVNERKAVGATPLRSGDRVKVGSTTFRYSE